MKRLLLIALLIVVAAYASLGWEYVRETSDASSCLSAGGSFDYMRAVCDREAIHPSTSFFGRHVAYFLLPLLPLLAITGYITWRHGLPYLFSQARKQAVR